MKRLLFLSAIAAIALGTIAAGSALAVETKKKAVSPKSATPPQTQLGTTPVVDLELWTKQQIMMSNAGGIRVNISIRLPKGVNQNCEGKATFSANGKVIGEAALSSIVSQSPDGPGHTKYKRYFYVPQKWEPPAWKAGKYEIGLNYPGGGSCPAASGKWSFTLKHHPTEIFLQTPAKGNVMLPFEFKTKLATYPPANNKPVKGVPIKVSVCGTALPAQMTDANGWATVSAKLYLEPATLFGKPATTNCTNPFPVTVTFEGDDAYQKASAEKKVPLN